jgi:hypothetical protein
MAFRDKQNKAFLVVTGTDALRSPERGDGSAIGISGAPNIMFKDVLHPQPIVSNTIRITACALDECQRPRFRYVIWLSCMRCVDHSHRRPTQAKAYMHKVCT